METDCLQILRIPTLLLCIVGFALNSRETFQKYFNKATLVLTSTQQHHKSLPLPVFIICNQTSFKRPSRNISVLNYQEYIKQTRNPFETLLNISKFSALQSRDFKEFRPVVLHAKELNTIYQGRCLCLDLNQTKVREPAKLMR